MTDDGFVDTTEVATLFGVTPARVRQLRIEHGDFPAPTISRSRSTFWKRTAIERWGRKHGYIDKEG